MFQFDDLFGCFPSIKIMAIDLMQGDIAKIHDNWVLVMKTQTADINNNGANFLINSITYYGEAYNYLNRVSYVKPTDQIDIIPRAMLDRGKLKDILISIEKQAKEYEKDCEEARQEEKRILQERRDEIDRELAGYKDE